MSSHFNYEIDERTLRARLKDLSLPVNNEAWLRFEEFSDLNCQSRVKKLPVIRLNFSRTLILPFVFGGVIILFSLLLVNFINIKPSKNLKHKNSDSASLLASTGNNTKPAQKSAPVITETKKTEEPVKLDTTTVKTPSISVTPSVTPSVTATPTLVAAKVNTPAATQSVSSQPASIPANTWVSYMSSQIYESPNIASKVIGNSQSKQNYKALEETNYFIKVAFNKNGGQLTGYIMKSTLSKGGLPPLNNTANYPRKRKDQKSETLEPKQTPMILGVSLDEKEPELK